MAISEVAPGGAAPNATFAHKKARILQSLSAPTDDYHDLSPKGSVDEDIRGLIDEINALDDCVTTSSCSGRVAVYLEGKHQQTTVHAKADSVPSIEVGTTAAVLTSKTRKGAGGRWLYVSHSSIPILSDAASSVRGRTDYSSLFGMKPLSASCVLSKPVSHCTRHVHFKFEPMVCGHLFPLQAVTAWR